MALTEPRQRSLAADLQAPLQRALATVRRNTGPFATLFPDDTSIGNCYQPRVPRDGYPAGFNYDWTPGFWTGMLWLAYEFTGDPLFRRVAEGQIASYAERITKRIYVNTHDLGFLYTLACVAPWRLTGNQHARELAIRAADLLLERNLDLVGIIQAWGNLDDPSERGRAIVDSLLNMPLLYWASEQTGQPHYAAAAVRHTVLLRDHMVREDATTYHTYFWNHMTGEALHGRTHQGYADNSCWARGQAWAIYGFVLNYRYTKEASFLETTIRCADYFLDHLPADHVAFWDLIFTDGSSEERDSSAAAIAVCGLQELCLWLPAGPQRDRYAAAADAILASLATSYAPPEGSPSNALLLHGVYSKPAGTGIDEANLWGDYFYLEALMRATKPAWRPYW